MSMQLTNLYAELQANPRNVVVYRELAKYYQSIDMENEAQAFLELIRKKFGIYGTDPLSK